MDKSLDFDERNELEVMLEKAMDDEDATRELLTELIVLRRVAAAGTPPQDADVLPPMSDQDFLEHASLLYSDLAAREGSSLNRETARKFSELVDRLAASRAPETGPDAWKETIIEACIVNHLGWDENDPVKTLANLIGYECKVALDPRVSKEAQDLIDQGTAPRQRLDAQCPICKQANWRVIQNKQGYFLFCETPGCQSFPVMTSASGTEGITPAQLQWIRSNFCAHHNEVITMSSGPCPYCELVRAASGTEGSEATRFNEFLDDDHPCRKWWNKHGQFMLSGGGHREFVWACRGWIAREGSGLF